jgi:hypothetical protein
MSPWRESHGVYTRDAWTVRLDFNPRSKVTLFELYDSTRYVRTFPSAQAAKAYADVYELSANDNRRSA